MVTAAKLVYSTWELIPPGERNGKAIYRNRFAPQPVHLLHPIGERQDVSDGVGVGGSDAVCQEAASHRRGGGGDHRQYAPVSRRGSTAGVARGGGGHESVS